MLSDPAITYSAPWILQQIARVRAETIEECAKLCEARAAKFNSMHTSPYGDLGWDCVGQEHDNTADHIRALAASEGK